VADEELKAVGTDGIFKLLTWRSVAITRIFGVADIEVAIKQEFQRPLHRRLDCLYRLSDGSILNIEHQSSLKDKDALARRMIDYRCMIRGDFPSDPIKQVVVYAGTESARQKKVPDALEYVDVDELGHGVKFSALLRNFHLVPADEFRKSGQLDDLILGLMTAGGEDENYVKEVVRRVAMESGEERRSAKEKFSKRYADPTASSGPLSAVGLCGAWRGGGSRNAIWRSADGER
jgi:hypothetical protein